jgi:cold shock CspA family protein
MICRLSRRMSNPKHNPSNERAIGYVKWYGGYNSKMDQENKFGFLESTVHGSVFAHESELICMPSDMKEGRWVTFRVTNGKKGLSANAVELAENTSDFTTISKLLDIKDVPIEIRLQVCFHIPLEVGHPLIPALEETIAEYDRLSFTRVGEFPNSWEELDRQSPLFRLLPEQIKQTWFNKEYPNIKRNIDVLSSTETCIKRNTEIYGLMSPQDKQLALSWAGNDSDYEKAKMLSARAAEIIIADFFSGLGRSVLDTAIHQVTGESDHWKSHDLLIDSAKPVDVKNARSTIHSNTFVEYTIKRFKTDYQGRDVILAGVLSPYLKFEDLERKSPRQIANITVLGTTTQSQVQSLEKEFSKRELTVDFGSGQRWPIWIFNNDLDWFSKQHEAVEEFSKSVDQVKPEDWKNCQKNVIPAFLIAGREVPESYRENLSGWQNWYLDKITEKSKSGELTLPWLYLFTFHHFLEAITNIDSAESKEYSPNGYRELLFYSEGDAERPASLIDPLSLIRGLIGTLNTLWDQRRSARLIYLRRFEFKGEGLIRGIDPAGNKVTVLAYCGGFVESKGKCGHSPLVIGRHDTCPSCRMLVCNICGYCSEHCKKGRENSGALLGRHL